VLELLSRPSPCHRTNAVIAARGGEGMRPIDLWPFAAADGPGADRHQRDRACREAEHGSDRLTGPGSPCRHPDFALRR
jgi:hypothetical protein